MAVRPENFNRRPDSLGHMFASFLERSVAVTTSKTPRPKEVGAFSDRWKDRKPPAGKGAFGVDWRSR